MIEAGEIADEEGAASRRGPPAIAERDDPLTREGVTDVLDRAEHRSPEGVLPEDGLVDQVLGHHRRLVVGPRDLLNDDAALAVELIAVDPRAGHEVGQQVGRLERPLGSRGDVKRDEVVARVRVQNGPDALGALVDLLVGGVLLAALEHEVLEEMRHPVLLGALGPGARVEGDQDRGRARALDRNPVQGQPVCECLKSDRPHALKGSERRSRGRVQSRGAETRLVQIALQRAR